MKSNNIKVMKQNGLYVSTDIWNEYYRRRYSYDIVTKGKVKVDIKANIRPLHTRIINNDVTINNVNNIKQCNKNTYKKNCNIVIDGSQKYNFINKNNNNKFSIIKPTPENRIKYKSKSVLSNKDNRVNILDILKRNEIRYNKTMSRKADKNYDKLHGSGIDRNKIERIRAELVEKKRKEEMEDCTVTPRIIMNESFKLDKMSFEERNKIWETKVKKK